MSTRVLKLLPLLSILLVAQQAQDPVATARKALDLLLAGSYPEFHQMSTADVQKGIPRPELAKLGTAIKAYGAVEKISDPQVMKAGPNTITTFPVKFANQSINFRIVINSSGLVAGIFQLPGAVNWTRPEYSKPDTFKQRDVTVGEGEWKLPGTLTLPNGAGPFPAAVLGPGSGPDEREWVLEGQTGGKEADEGTAAPALRVLTAGERRRA